MKSCIARLLAGLFIGAAAVSPGTAAISVDELCQRLSQRLRSVDAQACRSAGLSVDGASSVNGLPLVHRDYRPPGGAQAPSRILLIGGIHGDELTSVSIAFRWMKQLQAGYPEPLQWRVLPCANPDGLLARPSQRTNRKGVDLNRNFPVSGDWQGEVLSYWQSKTAGDPRRYPGPAALSEPETRWLHAQIAEFAPEAIVSIHAPYGVLDYDGPPDAPQRFGSLERNLLGTYPGSLGHYAGLGLGVPVVTLELPSAGSMPSSRESLRIWDDMLHWLHLNLPPRRAAAPAGN